MPKELPEPLESIMAAAFKPTGHSHPRKAQAQRVAEAFQIMLDEVIPEYRDNFPRCQDEKLRRISAYHTREKFLNLIHQLKNEV